MAQTVATVIPIPVEYLPAVHSKQRAEKMAPTEDEYVPAELLVQAETPEKTFQVPAGQGVHTVLPVPTEYVPPPQLEQVPATFAPRAVE